jgi:O-antigen/teichoic acid export membrane protein
MLATSLAILVLSTATGVILARLLGPTGRGHLAAALLWPNLFISVGSLGLSESVVFFSAQMPGQERVVSASGLVVAICQAVFLGAAWYIAAPLILGHYGQETVRASRYMVLAFPLALMPIVANAVLLGRFDVRSYNLQRLSGVTLTALGLAALYLFRVSSVVAVVVVYLAVGALTLGYSFGNLASQRWMGFRASRTLMRSLLRFGIRSHLGTVSGIANQNADQAVISLALSPFYLGLYSVALTLPAGVSVIGGSLATIALPAVAAAGSTDDMRRTLAGLVKATLALSALAAGTLAIATPALIKIFFGSAFLAGTAVAEVLLLASILASANRVSSAGLRAFNRPLQAGAGDLLAAIITVISLLLLVPAIGLMGAAIAVSLASAANFGFNLWTCTRLGISARALLIPTSADVRELRALLRQDRQTETK